MARIDIVCCMAAFALSSGCGSSSESGAVPAPADDVVGGDTSVSVDGLNPDTISPSDIDGPGADGVGDDTSEVADTDSDDASDVSAPDADGAVDTSLDVAEVEPGLPPCDPPLALTGPAHIATVEYQNLIASGGTGGYRFELVSDESGALVNELSGAYLSGGVAGVDTVQLTDVGCVGQATTQVTVYSNPVASPAEPMVPTGGCVKLQILGGSGQFTYEILSTVPVGTVDADGLYLSSEDGTDLVRVTDALTGRTVDIFVTADPSVTLESTVSALAIPVGGMATLPVSGGSGSFLVESNGPAIGWDGAHQLLAEAPGAALITVTDAFVGCVGESGDQPMTTTLPVVAMEALEAPTTLFSDGGTASAVSPGDLDGDGDDDAVLGLTDIHAGGKFSGAVVVVSANDAGEAAVVQVLPGLVRDSEFGHAMAVGDIDGDGQRDLAVGARTDSVVTGGSRRGRVYFYRGIEGGYFEPEPYGWVSGHENNEYLGTGVALCDFNGDGWLDLAAGAQEAEDESLDTVVANTGAVHIWYGGADGFAEAPDTTRWGMALGESGEFELYANGHLGYWVSAGDMNGDGACELVSNLRQWDAEGGKDDGAVLIYRGGPGGVSEYPVRFFVGAGNLNSQFGHRHEMGDVNGDGLADLVIGQNGYDLDGNNRGAVRLLLGSEALPTEPATTSELPDDFDWLAVGDDGGDELGYRAQIMDLNGDGVGDVVTMGQYDEAPTRPSGAGGLAVYFGVDGGLPAASPDRRYSGDLNGDRFGRGAASLGDLNGDGEAEMAVWSSHDDTFGGNAGRLVTAWGWEAPVVAFDEEWTYIVPAAEAENAPDEAWNTVSFDDSQWLSGPAEIGYGQEDEATVLPVEAPYPPSIYLRRTFSMSEVPAWARLRLRFNNGVAVYLNGGLISIHNVAEPVLHENYATTNSGSTFNETIVLGTDADWPFVAGENVLAVVLKVGNANDGNASFAAELQTFADAVTETEYNTTIPFVSPSSATLYGLNLVSVPDMTGDGVTDVMVSAREDAGFGGRSGSVFLYAGTQSGVEVTPSVTHGGFGTHGGNAQYGDGLAVGDVDGDGSPEWIATGRNASRPGPNGMLEGATVADSCQSSANSTGVLWVFETDDVMSTESPTPDPRLVVYGWQGNDRFERVHVGGDFNGDGKDDIVVASHLWDFDGTNNVGGVAIVYGQELSAGTEIRCAPDAVFYGRVKDDNVGLGLAAMGDLDGDGCDELALGAYLEDLGNSAQGTVRVLFGYGPGCSSNVPRVVLLAPQVNNAQVGLELLSGRDLDGDGMFDLVVGGPDFRVGSDRMGAVWMVPGSYVLSLLPQATVVTSGAAFPDDAPLFPLLPDDVAVGAHRIVGSEHEGRFGQGLWWVEGTGAGGAAVAVGAHQSDRSGAWRSGLVEIYEWTEEGWNTKPLLAAVGESWWTDGHFGRRGTTVLRDGQPVMLIGGYRATPQATFESRRDDGAVYVLPVP